MAVAKAKPGTVADSIAGGLGTGGTVFDFAVIDGDFDFWSPLKEFTSDADSVPIWENNRLLYGSFNLRGVMVSGSALTLSNLNKVDPQITNFVFTFHDARVLTVTIIVERIRIRWRKNAEMVGVALLGRTTDTGPVSSDI